MTPAEYDAEVMRRIDPKIVQRGPVAMLEWAIVKLNSEAGELAGLLARRDFHERDVDELEFVFEDGDCQFYVTVIANTLGYSTQTIMEKNIEKLEKRGNYAAYLQQQMQAERVTGGDEAQTVIAELRSTLRRLEDKYGQAESTE